MIITVTLNAALDITYGMPRVAMGDTNRVAAVREQPGGKGLNVARVLHALGEPVLACGLLGGRTGDIVRARLTGQGIRAAFTPIAGESRRTVVLAENDRTTLLNEPGPQVTAGEWQTFLADFHRLLTTTGGGVEASESPGPTASPGPGPGPGPGAGAGVVVLSGSLPPGVPADAYRTLIEISRRAGIDAILDADGEALRLGLAGRPAIVKPNAGELVRLGADPHAVRVTSTAAVVVSRGRDGLLALTPDGDWTAVPPAMSGNPTGAGDALVAALARGLAHGWPWPELLRHGAALSAAAVRADVAGAFDPDAYRALVPRIDLQPLGEDRHAPGEHR